MTNPTDNGASALRLADALCARLCHDLSSPLGTLSGALEMVAEDPDSAEDALPIAHETASGMTARLRLMRAAWAGDCGPLSVAQMAELSAGLPPRVKADFTALPERPFDGATSRALLNLLLLAAEALPRGGVVAFTGAANGDVRIAVQGKSIAWPAGLAAALNDPDSVPLDNPRAVQAPVTAMLVRAAGHRLSVLADAENGDALLMAVG